MNKNLLIIIFITLFSIKLFAQEAIEVTDQTFKIGGMKDEELYFGFAEGDKVIFNFNEENKKELKEIEIVEYPNNSKFSDYKTSSVTNKVINVTKQGVYVFRFKNSSISGRVCKINIQRIPISNDTRNFNSKVTWENRQETTFSNYTKDVLVGYDTIYNQKTKKELTKTEYSEDMIMDKTERVNSVNNLDYKNYKAVQVSLPQNFITTYKTKKIISWAYWIAVGKEGVDAWNKNVKNITNVATGIATIVGCGPLAKFALGSVPTLATPTMGDDVSYWFITDYNNAQLFMNKQQFMQFDKGRGVGAYGKNLTKNQGIFYIGLLNDNQFRGIDVNVKVSVVWETKYYEDQTYTEMKINPRYEKKQFSDPIIKTSKVPVTGQ